MKIQNFIFCWNEYVNRAFRLERELTPFGKTTVINSNVNFNYGRWININDGYFAEQWNTLLANVDDDTDYVFHIQADVDCSTEQLVVIFDRFREAAAQHKIGIYAPDVDYTPCRYDVQELKKIPLVSVYDLKYLHEVPNTDCSCWFINTDLMERSPIFDLTVNSMGWGADFYYIAKARLAGYQVSRDYHVRLSHPKKTTYDQGVAGKQFMRWLFLQDTEIFMEIGRLIIQYENVRERPDHIVHAEDRNPSEPLPEYDRSGP